MNRPLASILRLRMRRTVACVFTFSILSLLVVLAPALRAQVSAPAASPAHRLSRAAAVSDPDLSAATLARQRSVFVQNKGQWDSRARFLLQTRGMNTWITDRGVVYDLYRTERPPETEDAAARASMARRIDALPHSAIDGPARQELQRRAGHVVRMTFERGSTAPTLVRGTERIAGNYNYFLGNDRTRWATDVARYTGARIDCLYEGVDAVFYLDGERPRYDLVVAPGADPTRVAMRIEGTDEVSVTGAGTLSIATTLGPLEQRELYAYQKFGDEKRQVRCAFVKRNDGTVGFAMGTYDHSRPLVIDPLVYSTYLGGSYVDLAEDIAVDANGNAYVVGTTSSTDFPTTIGAYDTSPPGYFDDVFVTKLSSTGAGLEYSTFLGGSFLEEGYGIAVDADGSAYVTGYTSSSNFPVTSGAYRVTGGRSEDVFVTKLNPTGASLAYSTFIGGTAPDRAHAIALDASGNAYVTGYTWSSDFPVTSGAYAVSHRGQYDGFVTKLSSTGATLGYSTFLGGSGREQAYAIDLDGSGNAYVTGYTGSANFPVTSGGYDQSQNGNDDVFVTKLSSTGGSLAYSTFLGGTSLEAGSGIAVDPSGDAYVTGYTYSPDFPVTSGAYDVSHNGNYDAFVTKLGSSGENLGYSTFLGGTSLEFGDAIALDASGNANVVGVTHSADFPSTDGAYDELKNVGGSDVFVTKLNTTGTALRYSTLLGGRWDERAEGIALDAGGDAYVTGYTYSSDFPVTSGAYDLLRASDYYDAFVTRLDFTVIPKITAPNGAESWCAGSTQAITWTSSDATNVNLELSSDGGVTWTIVAASVAAASGSYAWAIPPALASGTTYRIRVSDAADESGVDASDANFAISGPPTVTVQPVSNLPSCPGTSVTFTANVAGTPAPALHWQWSADGVDFVDIAGEISTTLTIASPMLAMNGRYYRMRATNACAEVVSLAAQLNVFDATAPVPNVAELPMASGECGVTITSAPTATDNCAGIITGTTSDPLTYTAQGRFTVNWIYSDGNGNESGQTQTVVVADHTAPTISVTVNPASLWPPNHTMRPIAAAVTTADNCSGETYALTSITETDNGSDDDDLPNDIQNAVTGTADLAFDLRAERAGNGTGRVYSITYTVTDVAGNVVSGTATVSVPISQGQGKPIVGSTEFLVEHLGFASRSIPNPTSSGARIEYHLAEAARTRVTVHNAVGDLVVVLVDAEQPSGHQSISWNAVDAAGRPLPAGKYFYTIQSNGTSETGSMVLVR